MGITYTRLFHLMLDLGIKKGELHKKANITASIMARLARNESVRTETIEKICRALRCQPGDIMDYTETEQIFDAEGNATGDYIVIMPCANDPRSEEPIDYLRTIPPK